MVQSCAKAAAYCFGLCIVLATMQPARAEGEGAWKKLWSVSVATVVAANAADAATSLGRAESNPILRNAHGGLNVQRAAMIKASGTGGMLLLQYILLKRMRGSRLAKPAAVINFAAAAAVGAVAYRNSTLPKIQAAAP